MSLFFPVAMTGEEMNIALRLWELRKSLPVNEAEYSAALRNANAIKAALGGSRAASRRSSSSPSQAALAAEWHARNDRGYTHKMIGGPSSSDYLRAAGW